MGMVKLCSCTDTTESPQQRADFLGGQVLSGKDKSYQISTKCFHLTVTSLSAALTMFIQFSDKLVSREVAREFYHLHYLSSTVGGDRFNKHA